MLWCFYNVTTPRIREEGRPGQPRRGAAGRDTCFVEVVFEHNNRRYRSRRYGGRYVGDRTFSIMRIDDGHSVSIDNPDSFINTVIPKTMAGHFLFDGEHAEVFIGEENRKGIRRAVQDILGCNLIDTAIADLDEAATLLQKADAQGQGVRIDHRARTGNRDADHAARRRRDAREGLRGQTGSTTQQIADIEEKLRNSTAAKALQESRDLANGQLPKASAAPARPRTRC